LVSVLFLANVHEIFARLSTRSGKIRGYLTMFQLMYSMPDSTSELDAIKRQATERGGGVLLRLRELGWMVGMASISHNALFFLLVYLPLQFLFLYDFHVLNLIEIWQSKYGRYARDWFLALGRFEALASLSHLAHDHPEWSFPQVGFAADRFSARGLGHPLLPTGACVSNDVQVGPVGSFLLVTGSNMSGKSTLLRAIGVNAVLAEAGAPVCAAELSMPPVVLATSMRIHDSLEFGVSFYMAELMRLKQVVDLGVRTRQQSSRLVLYLLDEILQGTNSKERHIAVERVLEHLLRHGAIGAVSTHDLELAASPMLHEACRCVHFRETLHEADAEHPMTFDYRLRPGVATTTNALKLLELVGLGE
jgi:DNA mismatch repair ATPase MutS